MKQILNRTFSAMLALLMCVSLLELTVFAADEVLSPHATGDTIQGSTGYEPEDLDGWRDFADHYENAGNGWAIDQFDPNKSYDIDPETKLPKVEDGNLVERDYYDQSEVEAPDGSTHQHNFVCKGNFVASGSDGFHVMVSGVWACECGEVVYSSINVIDGRDKTSPSPVLPSTDPSGDPSTDPSGDPSTDPSTVPSGTPVDNSETETVNNQEIPLNGEPETEIEEPEVPLEEEPELEIEIEDPGVPLAEVPQTGDESLFWTFCAALSGAGLIFLALADWKRRSAGK